MSKSHADAVIDLYNTNASTRVEARSHQFAEQAWLDHFVEALPSNGRTVLDLGCGTGSPIANYLGYQRCQVTGVDGAAALIEIAK